ncbi:hypothetical protein GYMLUDRAFT_265360 [Collybiopsis luxurians FD-317 M1]|uniref:Uncharacterized protein n=1 Tax=Collybiopsis luxurians FD-317 M1 TaxID=944289 RepID=A0A0D0C4B6_9AGAR|nr:hypothetical protein GYMLUDRAFT_265360 [Collybiopsis luxurians FD-317 M1]
MSWWIGQNKPMSIALVLNPPRFNGYGATLRSAGSGWAKLGGGSTGFQSASVRAELRQFGAARVQGYRFSPLTSGSARI